MDREPTKRIGLIEGRNRTATAALLRRCGGDLVRIYDGSTTTVVDMLVRDAHTGTINTVVTGTVMELAAEPLNALRCVLRLAELGVEVRACSEEWLAGALDGVRPALRWVEEQERRARLEAIQRGVARARAEGRHPGRPRTVVPGKALELVSGGMSIGRAARLLGIAEATLRRRVEDMRTEQRISRHDFVAKGIA